MLELNAVDFMKLGQALFDLSVIFDWDEISPIDSETGVRKLNARGVDSVQRQLRKLITISQSLKLPLSERLLQQYLPEAEKCPKRKEKWQI